MRLASAQPLDEVLERDWDAQLFRGGKRPGLAPLLGWNLTYHTMRSKGSRAGFPDRVLVRDRRVIFAELKREKKVATPLTDEQRRWLDALAGAGCECYLWRPSDFEEVGRVLSKRWRYLPHGDRTLPNADDETPLLVADGETPWTPGSMWMPGHGRSDS